MTEKQLNKLKREVVKRENRFNKKMERRVKAVEEDILFLLGAMLVDQAITSDFLIKKPLYNSKSQLTREIIRFVRQHEQFQDVFNFSIVTNADYLRNYILFLFMQLSLEDEELLIELFEGVEAGLRELLEADIKFDELRIDGETYHTRNLNDHYRLANRLSQNIQNAIIAESSFEEIKEIISKNEKSTISEMKRLAYTHDTFLMNDALKKTSKSGLYEYRTAGDEKVCQICSALNGQTFKYSEAVIGINYPPMHPWCRCIAIPKEKE